MMFIWGIIKYVRRASPEWSLLILWVWVSENVPRGIWSKNGCGQTAEDKRRHQFSSLSFFLSPFSIPAVNEMFNFARGKWVTGAG